MPRNQVADHFPENKPTGPLITEQAREALRRQANALLDSGAEKWRFPIAGNKPGKHS